MELPAENPTSARLSLESEQSDYEMRAPISQEAEGELGEHKLCSTGPQSDFCMNARFHRASNWFCDAIFPLLVAL